MRRLFFSVLLYAALASAQAGGPVPSGNTVAPSTPRFKDIAPQAGLTVAHISSPEKRYIIESMSGGVGLIDCDNDGKLDIVTVNGSNVDRYRAQGGDLMVTLYHQDGISSSATSPGRRSDA